MDVYEYPEPAPGGPDGPPPAAAPVPAAPVPAAPAPAAAGPLPAATDRDSTRSTLVKGGGLLLAGLVAGAIGVAALHGSSTPALAAAGGPAAASAPFDRGTSGGRGGVDGEQHLFGTLSAVSSSSVTVKSRQGTTTTVPVSAGTQVLRDGSAVSLSSLKVGEAVLVHVLPSGSSTVAEKVLVGTVQGAGTGGPDGGGFGPPPGDRPDGGGLPGGAGSTTGGTSTNT